MEFLLGETLEARIQSNGPLKTEDVFPIVQQVSAGLNAAHQAGIVHRVFKAANVMLVPHGDQERTVIMDFGLAIDLDLEPSDSDETDSNGNAVPARSERRGLAGTPAYMSPEQVTDGELGPASDLYALGIVLFEMLTGRFPFDCQTPLEVALAHVLQNPLPLKKFVRVGLNWESTILKLLSKDPQDRYQSATDVPLALRRPTQSSRGHSPPPFARTSTPLSEDTRSSKIFRRSCVDQTAPLRHDS